jgi:hypothetical protein
MQWSGEGKSDEKIEKVSAYLYFWPYMFFGNQPRQLIRIKNWYLFV